MQDRSRRNAFIFLVVLFRGIIPNGSNMFVQSRSRSRVWIFMETILERWGLWTVWLSIVKWPKVVKRKSSRRQTCITTNVNSATFQRLSSQSHSATCFKHPFQPHFKNIQYVDFYMSSADRGFCRFNSRDKFQSHPRSCATWGYPNVSLYRKQQARPSSPPPDIWIQ